jgi:hypothetical protein
LIMFKFLFLFSLIFKSSSMSFIHYFFWNLRIIGYFFRLFLHLKTSMPWINVKFSDILLKESMLCIYWINWFKEKFFFRWIVKCLRLIKKI